jgi:chorismate synthase
MVLSGNQFGRLFNLTTFGESHGPAMGAVIEGCPAGVLWRQDLLDSFLERRRPGKQALTSARNESDQVQVLSGVYEGKTLGTPIAMVIPNQDARSQDYSPEKMQMRRGHATDLWQEKFGHSDPRGSGRASGRETVARVLGGAVARMTVEQLYPAARVVVFTSAIGPIQLDEAERHAAAEALQHTPWKIDEHSLRCPLKEKNAQMEKLLHEAKEHGESFGGIVDLRILEIPKGLGEPVFGKLKSSFADAFLGIGATTALEIGEGFAAANQKGNDFHRSAQDYGGIRGGLATGGPISLRVAFKPTSSLNKISQAGRHDPCIVPRAIPVLEAMVWLVLADQILMSRLNRI